MNNSTLNYRVMHISDYDAIIELWHNTDGIQIRDADSLAGIARYLTRNLNLSFVAINDNAVIGTIMAGHDGRRGYIQHLAVANNYRLQGIATHLLELSLNALKKEGIVKSHLFVLNDNIEGQAFWKKRGWKKREDFFVFSHTFDDNDNS